MFKDQRRVYQGHRSQLEVSFGEVATVKFQAGERAEPSLDLVEVPLVDIHSNDLFVIAELICSRPLPPATPSTATLSGRQRSRARLKSSDKTLNCCTPAEPM